MTHLGSNEETCRGGAFRALAARVAVLGALAGTLFALSRCGSFASSSAASSEGAGAPFADAGASGGSGAVAGGGAGGAALPPEKELEGSYRAPVTTGKYVWSANPDSGRVALIDASSLEVRTVEAGFGPTYLAAIPGQNGAGANMAVVLDVLSHDATLLRIQQDGSISTKTLPTHDGANSWAIGPSGHWAIAWSDARQVKNPDPTEGFQDVTVIRLDSGQEASTVLSVGYRPTSVRFDTAGAHAYAVTDPGISVIALDGQGPHVTDLVQVTDDPADNPASRDVTVTPDGSLALVRRDGSPDLGIVTLATGQRDTLTLPGDVTDLDLSQDGTRAVAVVRATSQVAVLPVPGIAQDPTTYDITTIDGKHFGSVSLSPDAKVALLYENAVDNDHVTILSLDSASYLQHRTVGLKAPVQAVFAAPDGQHAIAFSSPAAGSTKAGAFSVIPTTVVRAPRIEGTDAPPMAVAIAPAPSERALITVRDLTKKFGVYVVRMPSLQVDYVPLASPPIATGMVPEAGKGYVAQLNPDGRITFIDLKDGSARTLTGFELGAKIVE